MENAYSLRMYNFGSVGGNGDAIAASVVIFLNDPSVFLLGTCKIVAI